MCLCLNPEIRGSQTGGGNAVGLKTDSIPITLTLNHAIKQARDERRQKDLCDGNAFQLQWNMNEAVILSFSD